MVLDTSAVIAVLQDEATAADFVDLLVEAERLYFSTANLLEAAIVTQARYGDAGERELDVLLHRLGVEITPVTERHVEIARSAYRRFGKGRHSAGLNYGDCFAYALAHALDEPLLYVGNDFSRTDVKSATDN